ncbi:MAG: hypothetical protein ABSC64_02480 [Candidatus Korobacteraceae bacterium]
MKKGDTGDFMDDKRHLRDKAEKMHEQAKEAYQKKRYYECPTYVDRYNELLDETAQTWGDEVYQEMRPTEPSKQVSAYPVEDAETCMSTVVKKLEKLVEYLKVEEQR